MVAGIAGTAAVLGPCMITVIEGKQKYCRCQQ
jgi:hypothetical protein